MSTKTAQKPRILFVDAYDSFSNNIVGALQTRLDAEVFIIRIDDPTVCDIKDIVRQVDAVVVGPGPGNPTKPADVGFIDHIWQLEETDVLPVLGICLGFQSLGHAFGASIGKLTRPRHGIVSTVEHQQADIFEGVGDLQATQYHSLYVDLRHETDVTDGKLAALWKSTSACPDLQPLAWDSSDKSNGPTLMALRHKQKPFWGVQFHLESICTNAEGNIVLEHWWEAANEWLRRAGREGCSSNTTQNLPFSRFRAKDWIVEPRSMKAPEESRIPPSSESSRHWIRHPLPKLPTLELLEKLNLDLDEIIFLDSGGTQTGKFSIIGLVGDRAHHITYNATTRQLVQFRHRYYTKYKQIAEQETVWDYLQHDLSTLFVRPDMPTAVPFWGGWMGYISYEAGLQSIDVEFSPSSTTDFGFHLGFDINFAFVERSIVIDHDAGEIYFQSLRTDGYELRWLKKMETLVQSIDSGMSPPFEYGNPYFEDPDPDDSPNYDDDILSKQLNHAVHSEPAKTSYLAKVLECQRSLAEGESYELCLTDESTILLPEVVEPWAIYKRLHKNNPAPFGAYLRLPGATVIGSSPERFLKWDRQGNFQLRPIKGTVRKTPDMTLEKAEAILNTSKERAENLMIVDLIRHDVSGVVGARNVSVPKLMQVEEYHTVYQLVSVIEGHLPKDEVVWARDREHFALKRKRNSDTRHSMSSRKAQDDMDEREDTRRTRSWRKTQEDKVKREEALSESSRKAQDDKDKKEEALLDAQRPENPTGMDVLRASLPPGSMTGAPKKRSCEILAKLENRPRGIYSGVLGYMDVGGGGDFSVVIRTAFRHDDEIVERPLHKQQGDENGKHEDDERLVPHSVWRVGAGGAVTIQSTAIGEFEEMDTKLDSVLASFKP